MNPPNLKIGKLNGFGQSENGNLICIDCCDHNGQRLIIMIPSMFEGEFLATYQAAAQHAAKERKSNPTDAVVSALAVEDIQFGVADDHTIALLLKLRNGLTMNMALGPAQVASFQRALLELQSYQTEGGPGHAH